MIDVLEFVFDKLPYLVDFRTNELMCNGSLCNFVKTDIGNFFVNYFIIFNLLYFGMRYFRRIFYFFR